jgi:hypothetical protein
MKNLSKDLFIIEEYLESNTHLCTAAKSKKKYLYKGRKRSVEFETYSHIKNPLTVDEFLMEIKDIYYEMINEAGLTQ